MKIAPSSTPSLNSSNCSLHCRKASSACSSLVSLKCIPLLTPLGATTPLEAFGSRQTLGPLCVIGSPEFRGPEGILVLGHECFKYLSLLLNMSKILQRGVLRQIRFCRKPPWLSASKSLADFAVRSRKRGFSADSGARPFPFRRANLVWCPPAVGTPNGLVVADSTEGGRFRGVWPRRI
jgi:hypothetical protein